MYVYVMFNWKPKVDIHIYERFTYTISIGGL